MQRLLLVLCSLIATAPALAAGPRVAVDVRRDGDTFSINADDPASAIATRTGTT